MSKTEYQKEREAHNAYRAFYSEMIALESVHRDTEGHTAYFCDGAVDHENTMDGGTDENGAPVVDGSAAYWVVMLAQAISAAAYRMEEVGVDINKALGRVVF